MNDIVCLDFMTSKNPPDSETSFRSAFKPLTTKIVNRLNICLKHDLGWFSLFQARLWTRLRSTIPRLYFVQENFEIKKLSCAFSESMSEFFLSLNWHDWNNSDMNRIRTENVTCICSLSSNYSIEGSYDVTSGLFPVLSHVKFRSQKFYCIKRFAVKFPGESLGIFFTYESILWVLSSILTLMSVFWQIKAQLFSLNW